MRVLIIEDEAPAFRRLQKVIDEVDSAIEIIDVLDSISETVVWFKNNEPPDLVFMDIQLSDGLSLQIFDSIQIEAPIIFTTAFDEYLLEAFRVNSIDYLLKPIKTEDLSRSLEKLSALKGILGETGTKDVSALLSGLNLSEKQFRKRFLVRQGAKMLSIPSEQIAFFHTKMGVVHLTTFDRSRYIMDQNLDEVMKSLNPDVFFRANRQFIVNYDLVVSAEKYHKGKIIINTSIEVPESITISEERASIFKGWLSK